MVPTKALAVGFPYKTSTVIVGNTPGFYPNGSDVFLTIYYEPETQVIVGAEAFGKKGIDKRIDVLATAIYAKLTLKDLQNLDLAYAPPFSPAKDPVIIAGYAAENEVTGGFETVPAMDLMTEYNAEKDLLIDVRNIEEIESLGKISNAINIPLDNLRTRLNEIPKNKEVYIYCAKGTRGYLASKILVNNGYENVHNLMGGFTLWNALGLESESV
jgi:rhodanese-related sulfurtransferase